MNWRLSKNKTMRFLVFVFLVIHFAEANAQCESLHFAEIGYEPALCRIYGYQSGNGVVYAAAEGNTGPVTYQWTNLSTGHQSFNTTWGGLNVGEYKIIATDSIGCQITEIVKVDSINPKANFEIETISEILIGGTSALEISFKNKSDGWANGPIAEPPFADPPYFWWSSVDTTIENKFGYENHQVQGNSIAPFEVCLVSMNKNFCTDTLCKTLSIGILDSTLIAELNYSSTTGEIVVNINNANNFILTISNMSGTVVLQENLVDGLSYFQLYSGYFIYSIVDPDSNQIIISGTIFIY